MCLLRTGIHTACKTASCGSQPLLQSDQRYVSQLEALKKVAQCSQDVAAFLLSPEARDLRPLLLREVVDGMDLLARDQVRRAYSRFAVGFTLDCYSRML